VEILLLLALLVKLTLETIKNTAAVPTLLAKRVPLVLAVLNGVGVV
jgi:hypothetical protein